MSTTEKAALIGLAKSVIDGNLEDGRILLDMLDDRRDPRHGDFAKLLGLLCERSNRTSEKMSTRRTRSPEELQWQIDEGNYRLWSNFVDRFTDLFWAELHEIPSAQQLNAVQFKISTIKQSQRKARDKDDQYADETHGPMEGAPMSLPRGDDW